MLDESSGPNNFDSVVETTKYFLKKSCENDLVAP